MTPHPLALAYLRAFAEAHHARGHVVPTGMSSPAMQMHRARDAWQRAGCPLEAGPPTVGCLVDLNGEGQVGCVLLLVGRKYLHVALGTAERHACAELFDRRTGHNVERYGVRVVDHEAAADAWLRANRGGA